MGGKTWKSDQCTCKCATEDAHKLWERLEMVTLFLTMSAGVLLVIVKVLPVLGGSHAEGGHQDFRSSSPWLLENAAESASVRAEVSRSPRPRRESSLVPAPLPLYCTTISVIIPRN